MKATHEIRAPEETKRTGIPQRAAAEKRKWTPILVFYGSPACAARGRESCSTKRTRLGLIDSLKSHRKNRYHASTASVKPIAARAVEDSVSVTTFGVGFGVVGAGVAGVVAFGVGSGVGAAVMSAKYILYAATI